MACAINSSASRFFDVLSCEATRKPLFASLSHLVLKDFSLPSRRYCYDLIAESLLPRSRCLSLTHERWDSPGVFVALHNSVTFLFSNVALNVFTWGFSLNHMGSLELTTPILVLSLLFSSCVRKPKCLSKMASFASCVVGCTNAYQVYASLSLVRLWLCLCKATLQIVLFCIRSQQCAPKLF